MEGRPNEDGWLELHPMTTIPKQGGAAVHPNPGGDIAITQPSETFQNKIGVNLA